MTDGFAAKAAIAILLAFCAVPATALVGQDSQGLSPDSPSDSGSSAGAPQETLYGEDGSTPIYVRARIPAAATAGLAGVSAEERERADCMRFLSSLSPYFKAGAAEEAFLIQGADRETDRTYFKVMQRLRGIRVFGGEGRVTLHGGSEATYLGRFRTAPSRAPGSDPAVRAEDAKARAWKDVANGSRIVPYDPEEAGPESERELSPELVYYPLSAQEFRLAWHVAVRPNLLELWEYVVDAANGSILLKFPAHCEAGPATAAAADLGGVSRSFGTYQNAGDSRYYLIDAARPMFSASRSRFPDQTVGTIVTMDMKNTPQSNPVYSHITSTDNKWANPSAISAHYNAGVAYDYYLRTFGRNSINGSGGNIRSFINVPGTDGTAMDNAFWNGNAMYYGNGKVSMKPLAGGLDVAGHELTHGVVGATAALRYLGQSGALNESLADIFGAMIERANWKIGETVVKPAYFPTGALRDMSNPNQGLKKGAAGWQPAHMSEYQVLPSTQQGDMGGVHVNSGIVNRAFYLFATSVGKEKAEQTYYKALTQYLSASSQFVDMRLAVTAAAQDLFGAGGMEVKAAEDAFAAVGIGAPPAIIPKSSALALHSGLQFALLTRAGAGDGNTLYLADSGFTAPKPLSRTPLYSRPSVTDDGSTAIFVSGDGRIIQVRTDSQNPQETVLDANPVWEIAAISKDGKRYAAVKKSRDSSIYVKDIASGKTQRFPLYNPTNEGVRTGGAVYAGSLDWDHSGENVIYDAFNRLRGTGGSAIEYWDVGMLKAWDLAGNQFDEGDIRKPFGDLPDGSSAGNPVFAKNSPDVVVYEYLDPQTGFSIRAMDMETRKSGILASNTIVGFPSYDKRDSGIAYTTVQGTDTVIVWIALKADKITSASAPRKVATGFKWPVLFARGGRIGATSIRSPRAWPGAMASGLRAVYRPAERSMAVEFSLSAPATVRLSAYGVDGKLLERRSIPGTTGSNGYRWTMGTGRADLGLYLIRLETGGLDLRTRVIAGF